jgi:hypothetical protein
MQDEKHSFTLGYYEEFLRRLGEVYRFVTFREGKADCTPPRLILRHDIDMSLGPAVEMSAVEKELGVRATYFFMVRCPLYNVFSQSGSEQVKEILEGGQLGLHFDCSTYADISVASLSRYVARECRLLEGFFDRTVEAVSFHRPGRLELSGVELEGWPNSYEKVFLEKFSYFSDSRGKWARGNPLDSAAFAGRENLHILVHPVWWAASPATPYERLTSVVQGIKDRSEEYISGDCQVWNEGRKKESRRDR